VAAVALARKTKLPSPDPDPEPNLQKCDHHEKVHSHSMPEMQSFQCPAGKIQKAGTKGCSGGAFSFCLEVRKRYQIPQDHPDHQEIIHLFSVPKGTKDFRCNLLATGSDVDLYVTDSSTGEYLVNPRTGILHGIAYVVDDTQRYKMSKPKLETVYKNMAVKWSGDSRYSPVNEHFMIEGEATTNLDILVTNWGIHRNATVKFTYENLGVIPCNKNLNHRDSCIPLHPVSPQPPSPRASTNNSDSDSTNSTPAPKADGHRTILICAVGGVVALLGVSTLYLRFRSKPSYRTVSR